MNVGIVYRIFYGDLSYIGSTINLKQRLSCHMSNYKCNIGFCSSKEIICYDDFEVEVLAEIYYIENHLDINLLNLEREYIEQYKCVNKYRPIITEEERKEYRKEFEKSDKYKKYRKEHEKSDKRKEQKKEYNKEYEKSDKRKEQIKEYEKSDKRKEQKKEYMKQYYIKNKAT